MTLERVTTIALLVVLTTSSLAAQSTAGPFGRAWHTLRDPDAPTWYGGIWKTWSGTFTQGDTSILVPVNTFHMRFAYPPEDVARFTEWPLGVGIGRTRISATTSRMVYALTMQDSFGRPEFELGYIWLRNRYPGGGRNVYFGFGYTLNLLVRKQSNYWPFPLVLPIASVGYKRLSVGTTYVPGAFGTGNVFLTGAHLRVGGDGQ